MLWGGVLFRALLLFFLLLSTTFISCAGGAGSPASGVSAEATSLCIQLPASVEVPAKYLARTAQYAKVDSNFETFTVSITSSSYKSTKSCGRGEKLTFSNIPVGHYDVVALAKKADGAVTAKGTTTVDVEPDVTKTVRISLTRLDYHTVQFLNEDGSTISSQDVSDGYTATKPANPAPSAGKLFSFWTADATVGASSTPFDFNTPITGDTTLNPVFGVITYTVKYVSPVGSFTASDFTAATASSYILPSTSSVTGLTFADWYADAAFSTTVDAASVRDVTTFTKKDDLHYEKSIYAKWTATVQFKGENVSTGSMSALSSDVTVTYGGKVSNPGDPTVPTGATFGGWCTGSINESTGKVTFGSEYDFNSTVTEDITLYAKWNFVMHNVTYVSVPRAVPTGTATEFREIEGIPTLPTISSPTAAGCSFVGWTQDENFTLDTTPITSIPANTTTDVTLYAIWKVGVYFMNDLGSTTSFVVYGGALTKPTDPTKSGATFGGWYKGTVDGEGNVTLDDEAYDFDDADKNKVTKSIDLYPKWLYTNFTGTAAEFLAAEFASNTAATAYTVTITSATSAELKDIAKAIGTPSNAHYKDVYINLDLSGCGATEIEDYTFYASSSNGGGGYKLETYLTGITLPSGLTTLGNSAIRGCKGITGNITIPASVTIIKYRVFQDSGISSVTIPNTVTEIGEMAFLYCSNLTSVTIPASVNKFYNNVFRYCDNLATVTVEGTNKWNAYGSGNDVLNGSNLVLDASNIDFHSDSASLYFKRLGS